MSSVDYFLFELDADLALKQNPQACDSMSLYLEVRKLGLLLDHPQGSWAGVHRASHILMLWRDSQDLEVTVKAGWHFYFKELGIVAVDLKPWKGYFFFFFKSTL